MAVTIAGLAVACSNGDEAPASSTPQLTSISASDLSNLVLNVSEVSVDGTILPLDPEDSGPKSESDKAKGIDPLGTTAASIFEKYDWQGSYYQGFGGTGTQDSPVFNASVMLDLYDTPEHAASALAEIVDLLTTYEGRTYESATFESVELFDVPELNARGATVKVSLSNGISFTMTNIDFVRGPLIVDVGTASFDGRDLVPATLELAKLANDRLIAAGIEPDPNPAARSY